ncbi:hypothetical protein BDV93DRAFT_528440 [Ceratobasidium sp. AG-I]|nr:hypothetical protein BDV93DRAFT_528440 [Ceratobasidium sp. AG-I]
MTSWKKILDFLHVTCIFFNPCLLPSTNPPTFRHVNVAKFVGVTKTYAGLSGFVCAMDGLPFLVFASKAHSGAVWARCIRGFQDVVVSGPKSPYAQHITVAHNGHVTILPGRPGSMYIDLAAAWFSNRRPQSDPAVNVLIRVYAANHPRIGPNQLRTFIDSLNGLRHGFTELDIIKVAAICRLFPPPKIHFFTSTSNRLPPFQPEVGEFGRASYRNGQLVAWESLGFSRKIQRMNLNGKALFSGSLNWSASLAPSGNYWLTYALSKPFSHHGRGSIFADSWSCEKRLDESHRILWEDIFTEGQEMSQRSNVDLDDISFCYKICCDARFRRPSNAEFRELPASLYYHRSISSSNQYDTQGFFGVDKTPDSGLWHQRLKERGWELNFVLNIRTYNLHDDWGRRYERKLEQGLAAIPGSYPSAWVEEIL